MDLYYIQINCHCVFRQIILCSQCLGVAPSAAPPHASFSRARKTVLRVACDLSLPSFHARALIITSEHDCQVVNAIMHQLCVCGLLNSAPRH